MSSLINTQPLRRLGKNGYSKEAGFPTFFPRRRFGFACLATWTSTRQRVSSDLRIATFHHSARALPQVRQAVLQLATGRPSWRVRRRRGTLPGHLKGRAVHGCSSAMRARDIASTACGPAVPANSALVSDVCAAALRAFYNAPQRGRWASL
jgi:hypothetical protein